MKKLLGCCIFCSSVFFMALASNNLDVGVPGACDQVVDRRGYALGYSEEHEQPLWVQYRFTRQENESREVSRTDDFCADPAIKTGSATLEDYRGSGLDRGHLAPAADMKWSRQAMSESFLLSNISPQVHEMNGGIWNDVEKFVRYTVNVEESVVVVTGPVFKGGERKIGINGVTVPWGYYKIIYDETEPRKMIAFVVPNKGSSAKLASFVRSVDEVEEMTGLDFFKKVKGVEALERRSEIGKWRKLSDWRRSPEPSPWGENGSKVQYGQQTLTREEYFAGSAQPVSSRQAAPVCKKWPETGFWLSTNSNKRHNSKCPNYRKTRGYPCQKGDGTPCGICGG